MKFIVIRSNLSSSLSITGKIIKNNLNLPILKNVLIEAVDNKIKLISTDLEIAVTCLVSCKVIEKGKFTVPINSFLDLVENVQSERLNVEKKDNKLEIITDNYEALLNGAPADEFPITPQIKNKDLFIEIKSLTIKNALSQVLIASKFSDLRPELNSIFFNFTPECVKLTSTDSFRLAEKTISSNQFNTNNKNAFSFLLPLKSAYEIVKIISEDYPIRIYCDESQVLLQTEKIEILSRIIDGKFPDYEQIVPKKFSTEALINKEEFTQALRLASIFGGKNNEVKIKVFESKKVLEISSADSSIGGNKYIVGAKIKGDAKEITFNWRYLTDAVKTIESNEIFFGINKENEPSLLKPHGDASYFYILKPISNS